MLVPFEFCGANLKAGRNEIVVHIIPAMISARKYELPMSASAGEYCTGSLYLRKAPSQYGWDIMPRAVSGGIWRHVSVELRAENRIDDVFMYVTGLDLERNTANLMMNYSLTMTDDDLSVYRLSVKGVCGTSVFTGGCGRLWNNCGRLGIYVGGAKFWFPCNYGEPNLYDVTVTLWRGDEAVSEFSTRFGIRTVKLDRTSVTDGCGSGEFCFIVNGKRVFALGSNWVPVDAYHSRDRERLPQILPMLADIGCNTVRCWGGNVYEDDYFYDWCDENGIMVWQDFAMACAVYPQDKLFQRLLSLEVEKIVKRLRGHCSIVLWAGDNECDCAFNWGWSSFKRDPNTNVLTRKIIPDQLANHDLTRPYLPSSPYIDEEAFKTGRPTSEDHLWGPRDYFKGDYYKKTVCHFASETGYHGCPSPESLRKFISGSQLWHWSEDRENPKAKIRDDWACHAACACPEDGCTYRIRLMSSQVKTLFGAEPRELDDYARASQISQAEAKKYFIERFRVSKWRRTGIIWWNLIDGWPQISDAVVDWYGVKKLAYHYIKRSQQPLCLMFDEPEMDGTRIALYAVNDNQTGREFSYEVVNLTEGMTVLSGEGKVGANESARLANLPIEKGEKKFYFIKWKFEGGEGENHYFTNILDIDYHEYIGYMKRCGFYSEFEGFGE